MTIFISLNLIFFQLLFSQSILARISKNTPPLIITIISDWFILKIALKSFSQIFVRLNEILVKEICNEIIIKIQMTIRLNNLF